MRKIVQLTILAVISLVLLSVPSSLVYASCTSSNGDPSANQTLKGVNEGQEPDQADCAPQGVPDVLQAVVRILSHTAGAVAIIMIMYAGYQYITSNGNQNKTNSARNSLLYAIIGLVIAAASELILHFVIHGANVGY